MRPISAHRALERRLAALAASQYGVVAARQLLALGFTRDQIKLRVSNGRLEPLHAGVYAVGHACVTREGRWLAAVLACGRGAVLSHRDAAALWGFADYAQGPIEVTVPGGGSRSQPGLRIHRARSLAPADGSSRRFIPATSPARTLLDLAAVVALRHLEPAVDAGLRSGLVDAGALAEHLERNRGRRGVPALRELMGLDPRAVSRTRSPLEAQFLRFCREEGLPMPLVNRRVAGYEVDMHWPNAKLIVELDGYEFHGGRASFERDRAKWAELAASGYRVVVVTHRRLTRERARVSATLRRLLDLAA